MRIERDSLGEMAVPEDALYGPQTARALQNFPISGIRFPRPFLKALGAIKAEAARFHRKVGWLDEERARAIAQAAEEVAQGKLDAYFPLDVFQTGSGTSTNMNANEVIAHRALEILGMPLESRHIHPNDHVNLGQSSNDVIPTALHVAAADVLKSALLPALETLREALEEKAQAFRDIVKIGRTHLMDATPVTLGQEVSGWARQVALAGERLEGVLPRLCELALGGTAVGTGLNAHPDFGRAVAEALASRYGLPFREAKDHFEAQGAQDAAVELSGQLRTAAVSLYKIANDVRLLNSGPRCALAEVAVPAVQPGSSIMPGKVNPVIAESLMQVCAQVLGNDAAIAFGGSQGNLELNTMLPLIAHNLLQAETILARAADNFARRCIRGLSANEERAAEWVEKSLSLVTALVPVIGYDRAAEIAKRAFAEGKTVREVCLELKVLPEEDLDALLDPRGMLAPR
ncbi:MAG: class II fumarate hydratase [Gammaproteobacteria bacterium]|nr:MAG: class II fumarate hydratase [Gammaproteobacteria bacterium]